MAGGISSENIDPVSISTEVLVNGPEGTGRQKTADLSAQLAVEGALAEKLNGLASSAELAALRGGFSGNLAEQQAEIDEVRNLAFDQTKIYPTTAEGLAATEVGQTFNLTSADPDVALYIYRHDAGGVATLIATTPSVPALADRATVSALAETDARTSGIQQASGGNLRSLWSMKVTGGGSYQFIGADLATGRLILARLADQTLANIAEGVIPMLPPAPDVSFIERLDRPGWYAGNTMMLGLNRNFELEGIAPSKRYARAIRAAADMEIAPYDPIVNGLLPKPDILLLGDSMSTSLMTSAISEALGGRTVGLLQKGGQDAYALAVIMGVIPLTITLDGNTIPASGGVAVTGKSTNILFSGGTYTGTANVTVAGIAGILSTDSSGNWTFTRSAAGADVAVAVNVPAVLNPTVGTSFIPATTAYVDRTLIIWLGRNGAKATRAARVARTIEPLRKIAAAFTPLCKRIIYVTPYNQSSPNEPSGSTGYQQIMTLTEEMRRELGPHVIDMRTAAVKNAVYDLGITPDSTDLADMSADCIPTRFFTDPTHVNATLQGWQGNFIGNYCRAVGY